MRGGIVSAKGTPHPPPPPNEIHSVGHLRTIGYVAWGDPTIRIAPTNIYGRVCQRVKEHTAPMRISHVT